MHVERWLIHNVAHSNWIGIFIAKCRKTQEHETTHHLRHQVVDVELRRSLCDESKTTKNFSDFMDNFRAEFKSPEVSDPFHTSKHFNFLAKYIIRKNHEETTRENMSYDTRFHHYKMQRHGGS